MRVCCLRKWSEWHFGGEWGFPYISKNADYRKSIKHFKRSPHTRSSSHIRPQAHCHPPTLDFEINVHVHNDWNFSEMNITRCLFVYNKWALKLCVHKFIVDGIWIIEENVCTKLLQILSHSTLSVCSWWRWCYLSHELLSHSAHIICDMLKFSNGFWRRLVRVWFSHHQVVKDSLEQVAFEPRWENFGEWRLKLFDHEPSSLWKFWDLSSQ